MYKEIEVSPENKEIRFGTENGCDFRVRKDLFFEPIELTFSKDVQGQWSVMCSDNLYISMDEVRKILTAKVQHGTELLFKYQKSSGNALYIQFLIDFDYEHKEYNRKYDTSSLNTILIGSASDNNIILGGQYTSNDKIILNKKGIDLELFVQSSTYGVYHNGNLINKQAVIKNGDFFSVANYSFYYKNGSLFTQQSSDLKENGIRYSNSTKRMRYPVFNRNSRVKTVLDDTNIEILDPPAIPKKPKNNLLTRLLPAIVMIVASIIVGFGGGFFILISLASALAGIVTSIIGVKEANKDYKKEFSNRITKYNAYIENKRIELNQVRLEELNVLQDKYISEQEELSRLKKFSYTLFDRCKEDEDFLDVRLGIGKLEAKRKVAYRKQERLEIEDDLQNYPMYLYEQYKYIDEAPITCNFKESNAVGIIGNETNRFGLMNNIILDICARQYHSDVQYYFIADKNNKDKIYWLRMLPQVHNDVLGIHNIVCDDNSRNIIFEYLYKELTLREQNQLKSPHIIVFLCDECGFKSHPLSRFVENAKELGVTFVYFGDSRADIGLGCKYLIESLGNGRAQLIDTDDNRNINEFVYTTIPDTDMRAMVQLLSPVYTEEISLEGTLTKNISLFELLNIIAVDDIDLSSRWNASKVYQSMSAPIGVSKSGMIALDIHDKAHGPHGLVAGTTGAGKSEILQTYIMSMATLYHPYEVGFVIIDFKGGGMANQFKNLPHMMGTITNIDGKEINRSLKSIRAELKKRQRLFAEVEVNHIDKYIIKFRDGEASTPLPHLILIVDEFAELKAEQPEFMKELISAARIGRSLGVHLILATQKPSGQVDEQIWSNSRFKLCLKVQSQQDSNEVIKSPLAAEIKEPGRAYLQVGNNEIFELFQSAYSGAPEHMDDSSTKEFTIYEISASGKRIPVYQQKKKQDDGNSRTQLDSLVQYVKDYCDTSGLIKLPNICLPSLGNMISFPEENGLFTNNHHIIADLGIYDDPDNQVQNGFFVDLSEQNMMIIGSAQTGKTNVLQTIIRSLATKYSPEEVNIYVIDFASMYLKNFEALNHVGGVVTPSEDEKFKNLFKLIDAEIVSRKELLLSAGVSSYLSYKEMGHTDLPHIVIIIDNLTLINELYLQDEDVLLPVCREGLSLGISVVLANAQTSGIGYKYMSNFENKLALNCNDNSEYSTLFGYSQLRPDNVKGRALIEFQKELLEAQVYMAFAGEKEIEKITNVKSFIDDINQSYKNYKAKVIPAVLDILTEDIWEQNYGLQSDKNRFFIGINFAGVEPFGFEWINQSICCIVGDKLKEPFLQYIQNSFVKNNYLLYIMDDYTGEFEKISDCECVQLYSRSLEDTQEVMADLAAELEQRRVMREVEGMKAVEEMIPIVMMIHNNDWAEYVSDNRELLDIYKDILDKYRGLKCLLLFTNLANEKINEFQACEVLKAIKKKQNFIVFKNIKDIELFDTTTKERQMYGNALRDGEAFVLSDHVLSKVKTITLNEYHSE